MIAMPLDQITIIYFEASYGLALLLDLASLLMSHRRGPRLAAVLCGGAGLFAQTAYLFFHPPALSSQMGSLLFLSWILAIFYVYGSVHHRKRAWGLFVLPLIIGLIELARVNPADVQSDSGWLKGLDLFRGSLFWRVAHYSLLLMAAVGVCVAFIASLMYLVQAHRLKAKLPPREGLRLLSLERLEEMNRRAINWAFPLLTGGVIVGVVLGSQKGEKQLGELTDLKIVGTWCLWILFSLLLYLRYGFHLRGRSMALLTILAFGFLLVTLTAAHPIARGGHP
jgi:ABC-type transport system involved in cytochrome c biogenesis permease subunit